MLLSSKEINVRYAETDQMGVVYHANYLIWFEIGRTALIADLGFSYAKMEEDGIVSPVMDLQISFKRPVRYGQTATVKTWIDKYDGIRVTYSYEIFNELEQLCVSGSSVHTCVKKDTFRPIALKRNYPAWHEAYENAKKKQAEM